MLEIDEKVERLARLATAQGLGGILLNTQPNFAWLTGGRSNRIDGSRENGSGSLLVSASGRRFVVANNIEMPRLQDEALAGLGFTPCEYAWTDEQADPGTPIAVAKAGRQRRHRVRQRPPRRDADRRAGRRDPRAAHRGGSGALSRARPRPGPGRRRDVPRARTGSRRRRGGAARDGGRGERRRASGGDAGRRRRSHRALSPPGPDAGAVAAPRDGRRLRAARGPRRGVVADRRRGRHSRRARGPDPRHGRRVRADCWPRPRRARPARSCSRSPRRRMPTRDIPRKKPCTTRAARPGTDRGNGSRTRRREKSCKRSRRLRGTRALPARRSKRPRC